MSRAQLEQSLAELRRELEHLGDDARDSVSREKLLALVAEIEGRLDERDDASPLEGLRHQVEAFEVEHPRITAILNDIMVTLSNMGI